MKFMKHVLLRITIIFLFLMFFCSYCFSENYYEQKSYPYQNPEGDYLVYGGVGFCRIEERPVGEFLKIYSNKIYKLFDKYAQEEKYLPLDAQYRITFILLYPEPAFGGSYEKGKLILKYPPYSLSVGKDNNDISTIFVPSQNIKGDWDSVYIMDCNVQKPAPSMLHKVKDKRIYEYFVKVKSYISDYTDKDTVLKKQIDYAKSADIAKRLIKDYPEDYFIRTIYYDSLLRNRDFKTLQEDLEKHKNFYLRSDNLIFERIFSKCQRAIYANELSEAGINSYDHIAKIISREVSLNEKLKLLPGILKFNEYAEKRYSILDTAVMNFLDVQVSSKVFVIMAYFKMLQGEREEACSYLLGTYNLGNLLGQADNIISQLIGIAVRAIALKGLEIYGLNCCETTDELKLLLQKLNDCNSNLVDDKRALKLIMADSPFGGDDGFIFGNHFSDYLIRKKTTDSKLQSLRCAIAAKQYFLNKKSFPANDEDIASLIDRGIPKDPFGTTPIRYILQDNVFKTYSIGPDEQDDGAAFAYDPTNGTISTGDIFIQVPSEREFPFPKNGLKAVSYKDVIEKFPNGLPPDGFADTKGKSLGITKSKPVIIYSYGPDTDEYKVREIGDNFIPQIHYDPTNGSVSYGDLFIELKEK